MVTFPHQKILMPFMLWQSLTDLVQAGLLRNPGLTFRRTRKGQRSCDV